MDKENADFKVYTKNEDERIFQETSNKLGITQDYNSENKRKLWDSPQASSDFKEDIFAGKKTYVDPSTKKVLHKSQSAAQKKYHMKNSNGDKISKKWAAHSAEVDHIVSLKEGHNVAKHNPFLSDNDFKEIINSNENYRILSKSENASKGEKSDWERIFDKDRDMSIKARTQIAKEKINADITLNRKFLARSSQNIGKEIIAGSADALTQSVIPLTAEAVRKMCKVASGEESFEDAVKDMQKSVVDVAVTGAGIRLTQDIAKLTNHSGTAQIITVALMVKESAIKYVNGEIDGEEFIEEVGEKGAVMVTGMIGGAVGREIGTMIGSIAGTVALPGVGTAVGGAAGRVIGEILGTIITTISCSAIISVYNTFKSLDNYKLKERQIKMLETAALNEMKSQREKFKNIIEMTYRHWDDEVQKGFDQMLSSACEETFNLQGLTDGLDRILAVFGKEVAFKNLNEYEAQLNMPLKLSF